MKKILLLLLILTACAPVKHINNRAFQMTNVGTVANDGTGDPIRTFAQKQNSNWVVNADSLAAIRSSVNAKTTSGAVANQIKDTVTLEKSKATDLETFVNGKLASFGGTGKAYGRYTLKCIIGTTTGCPVDGDSLIINDSLIVHPSVDVYRGRQFDWENTTNANSPDGHTFNNATGTITFKPPLSTGELIVVRAYDPIIEHTLIPQGGSGGGGGSGASPLLNGALGYWSLDETSGTTILDKNGSNVGTTTATVNTTGIQGKALHFVNTTDDAHIPYSVTMDTPGDTMSVSMWIKLDVLPSVAGVYYYLWSTKVAAPNYWSTLLYINTSDQLVWSVHNSSGTEFDDATTTSKFSINTWYHLVGVCPGNGKALKLYVNNVESSVGASTFTGTLLPWTIEIMLGASGEDVTDAMEGYMDEVFFTNGVITAAEVSIIYNSGLCKIFPF